MEDTFQKQGIIHRVIKKEKYSQVVIKYYNNDREQLTPFTAMSKEMNEEVCKMIQGKFVTIDFWVGGKESNNTFYPNLIINKIIY